MSKKPTFGVFSPSSYINAQRFEPGLEQLKSLGHNVIVHPQTYGRLGSTQLPSTVEDKLTALYDLMANPDIDVVMASNGGQTSARLLPHIDYNRCTKPFLGYSDSTSLLNGIHAKTGKIQYHGMDVQWFRPQLFRDHLYQHTLDLLAGQVTDIPIEGSNTHIPGSGTGPLIGGNLPVFQHLLHTPYCPKLGGAILFFEDIGDELTSIDRTLNYFRMLGLFDRAAGLIFGQFTDMRDTGRPFGFNMEEIITTHTAGVRCPVITDAPVGHGGLLTTFPLGATATLSASMTGIQRLTLAK